VLADVVAIVGFQFTENHRRKHGEPAEHEESLVYAVDY
jgi:hypothetical protein